MLHGASEVEVCVRGHHHILKRIRQQVGAVPIYMITRSAWHEAVNMWKRTVIRSYREITDARDNKAEDGSSGSRRIRNPQHIHAAFYRKPLIPGGNNRCRMMNRCAQINEYMDWGWNKTRASWSCSGMSVIFGMIPMWLAAALSWFRHRRISNMLETIADQLAEYVWKQRHEFHYTGRTAQPEEASKLALNILGNRVVITIPGILLPGNNGILGILADAGCGALKKRPCLNSDPDQRQMLNPKGSTAASRWRIRRIVSGVDLEVRVKSKGEITSGQLRTERKSHTAFGVVLS